MDEKEMEVLLINIAPEHKEAARAQIEDRLSAQAICKEFTNLDPSDCYHVLRNLRLSPAERLYNSLSKGRIFARLSKT